MPPKAKIQREDILRAAIDIVRANGTSALNARTVAATLHCSTQPVFSNFDSMEALQLSVVEAADGLFQQYMAQEMQRGEYPPYKASGMAYIRFAKEEQELFKLLYMRDRAAETIPDETDAGNRMAAMVQANTGLGKQEADLFHLEMWAYVHGIAAMIATGYLELEQALISRMLTDCYQGLKSRFEKE